MLRTFSKMSFNFLAQHLSPSLGILAKQQSQHELHLKVQKMVVNMKEIFFLYSYSN
jgi:hypothetical protein